MSAAPGAGPRRAGFDAVFRPRSIAVVGASSSAEKIGGRPVRLLRQHGFPGAVYPINPGAGQVQGLPAFAALADLPEVPDLVVVAVPGPAAVAAVAEAGQLGVGAAVVLSSGFTENGPDGAALQRELTRSAQESGIRVVGPNCLGTFSVRERAIGTFSIALEQSLPDAGGISIVSQSGNLGSAALSLLAPHGAGLARFVATGNEADVEASDAVAWLATDPDTSVVLLVLETCRDSARLTAALGRAREAGKPVVVLKIGTSEAGQQAALSHTGALAGSDKVFDAVFARYGALRVQSLEELVQVGAALEVVGRRRVGAQPSATVVAASGGFGVMMADAAARHGVGIHPLGEAAQARIREVLPLAATANPVDTTAQVSADPGVYEAVVDAALSDGANTTVCLMLSMAMDVPRMRATMVEGLRRVTDRHRDRAVVACLSGPADAVAELRGLGIACFPSVDAAMAGVAALGRVERLREAPATADAAVEAAPLDPASWRNEATARAALQAAGLPYPVAETVGSADEAAAAAERIGGAVALKILSPDILHKSDVGGVALGVRGAEEARAAFAAITGAATSHAPDAALDGVLVAPMVGGGTELILGTTTDPGFGPVVMVGLGGVFTEILGDTVVRLAPVTEDEARDMVRSLQGFPLLDGARGRPPADVDAVARAVAALSRFAVRHQQDVTEIDINPVLAGPRGEGAMALDALIVPRPTQHEEVPA
ncbi:acetate--CoA ligase family protein [Klenkia sp. LSe6-5]|uniref:Acetate--CoA ligase family protein n=1 Tax=Klenkia sesuvii TaxID=3103137 RepID=A0ABU8DYY1_9ACTN